MILVGLIVLSLALGLTAWLGFVWSVRSGQYEDPEGPKYRMLEEEEDEAVRHTGRSESGSVEGQGTRREAGVQPPESAPPGDGAGSS